MGGIRIELVKCTDRQVILTLSPRMPLVEIKTTFRSSVLVVPINVPSTSTIANAMGRAAAGEKWIAKTSTSPANGVANGTTRLEASQDSILRKLHTSISQKRPQAADEAFFAWTGQEEKRKLDSEGPHTVLFGYGFTKQVLETVLQLDQGAAEILYSGKVVRSLLERKVVVARMVPDGLLSALVDRSDWVWVHSLLPGRRNTEPLSSRNRRYWRWRPYATSRKQISSPCCTKPQSHISNTQNPQTGTRCKSILHPLRFKIRHRWRTTSVDASLTTRPRLASAWH